MLYDRRWPDVKQCLHFMLHDRRWPGVKQCLHFMLSDKWWPDVAGFLFYKAIQSANKDFERADKADGY